MAVVAKQRKPVAPPVPAPRRARGASGERAAERAAGLHPAAPQDGLTDFAPTANEVHLQAERRPSVAAPTAVTPAPAMARPRPVATAPGALRVYRMPFKAMACGCEVVLAAADEAQAQAWAWQAVAEVQRIEAKFSRYRDDSVLSRINAAAGSARVACDDETLSLLQYARTLHQASGGLFDITAGVLRRAWNFRVPRVPSADELAPLLELIDFNALEIEGHHVGLRFAGMEIDFGGFGKEYAADRAGALLAERGVRHGYVNLGGDMRFMGPKPDGSPWHIGIQHPRQSEALVASLPVSQGGLATSGDYERYFELDGQRYCHLLNPRTGMPVGQWQTISVLAPLAVAAGHCTTIAMLMEHEALAFLDATGVPYLAVDFAGQVHKSDAVPLATSSSAPSAAPSASARAA